MLSLLSCNSVARAETATAWCYGSDAWFVNEKLWYSRSGCYVVQSANIIFAFAIATVAAQQQTCMFTKNNKSILSSKLEAVTLHISSYHSVESFPPRVQSSSNGRRGKNESYPFLESHSWSTLSRKMYNNCFLIRFFTVMMQKQQFTHTDNGFQMFPFNS